MPDFLNFVAPVDSSVSHYRVLCDATPHSYLVLMSFRDEKAGHAYYKQYNNRKFSSMEDEVCQIVYIQSIVVEPSLRSSFTFTLNNNNNNNNDHDGIANCPVCLEPMDEALQGLLTISCQHTFHVHCLSQWGDGSCPVCRYSQKSITGLASGSQDLLPHHQQEQHYSSKTTRSFQDDFRNECHECGCTDNLWICLVCGQIGCGRAKQGHALAHYQATSHLYALDIETQRVWDYAGDGYVHRLIQNVVDGKIVELPSHIQHHEQDHEQVSDMTRGKMNAMALEYSYLLTSQLDSQRMYFEDRINQVMEQLSLLTGQCKDATTELDSIHADNQYLEEETNQATQQMMLIKNENSRLVQKISYWKDKSEAMNRNYLEEKELAASLSRNNDLVTIEIQQVQQQLDALTAKSTELMTQLEMQNESTEGH
ncbi:hypothetical protein BC941DRAFT_447814 [Chlamydoabsidia padenii]|nr:hypothetical protein BC941DRAFT_447814 [Chlamydoabsidia padenii]